MSSSKDRMVKVIVRPDHTVEITCVNTTKVIEILGAVTAINPPNIKSVRKIGDILNDLAKKRVDKELAAQNERMESDS